VVPQYTAYLVPFAAIGLYHQIKKDRLWFGLFALIAIMFGPLLIYYIRFKFTPRDLYFAEVFFIPGFLVLGAWIAYGFSYVLGLLEGSIKFMSPTDAPKASTVTEREKTGDFTGDISG